MNRPPSKPTRAPFRTCLPLAFAALTWLSPAVSTGQDFATRSAARKLGEEGIALFDKGQYAEALEKFNLADQLVPAPTLGLRAARSLVKLGRLVEATERYLAVTRMDLSRTQVTPAFRKAQADALKEREELLPLIPSLTIEVTGPLGDGITVYVDGTQIPLALLGQKRPIDPGPHEVEVRRGETKVKKKVDLVVKQTEKVVLMLPPLPKPKPPEPDPFWRTIAWVGIGVGAGGMVAFGVTGGLALSKEQELTTKCPNRTCQPEFHADADFFDALRYATTAGLVVGVVGLGVGVPLLIAGPTEKPKKDEKKAAGITWTPVLGIGTAGVRGTF
ncbi:tetratricopeptide repeat protein [Polyangium jinanense]|uniref:PEGA domain-containing protein n=1 Tax=Polyangium jinanense TaxID=2829994 RepID=A0A9X3XIM9_9BACT|nr:hypothetical protein [Polyangium jinanense]MDC3961990.1 hypothetical protein [Polyangium jinanense]MDC3988886.1 hypothetical protein [Polyangium jinanense]